MGAREREKGTLCASTKLSCGRQGQLVLSVKRTSFPCPQMSRISSRHLCLKPWKGTVKMVRDRRGVVACL